MYCTTAAKACGQGMLLRHACMASLRGAAVTAAGAGAQYRGTPQFPEQIRPAPSNNSRGAEQPPRTPWKAASRPRGPCTSPALGDGEVERMREAGSINRCQVGPTCSACASKTNRNNLHTTWAHISAPYLNAESRSGVLTSFAARNDKHEEPTGATRKKKTIR